MSKKLEERIKKIELWMKKIDNLLYGNMRGMFNHIGCDGCLLTPKEPGLIAEINLLRKLELILWKEVFEK